MIKTLLVSLVGWQILAATPPGCSGSLPVGTFRLTVGPGQGGPALPVRVVNRLGAGRRIRYEPLRLPADAKSKAQVAAVLVPDDAKSGELIFLDPRPASEPAEWPVARDATVVALIFGPHGLNVSKLRKLTTKNEELLTQLADYAQQTSQVEALVQTLAASEQSGHSLDAALNGFSSRYGVAMPRLDSKAATDEQAAVLLRALMPSVSTYDPLVSSRTALMQQSAGLAASVAGLFFGSPVGLAAGGASLFQNLRTAMFPDTEFRTAFAQMSSGDSLALCASRQPQKSRTRLAYLWAWRIPGMKTPSVSLAGEAHVPVGSKSPLAVKLGEGTKIRDLDRVRDWKLVAADGTSFPAAVSVAGTGLEIDLTKTAAPKGAYQLSGEWDWDALPVAGTISLHPYGDMAHAALTSASRGKLAEGRGRVTVTLAGADFEFVEKVSIQRTGKRPDPPLELRWSLPNGKRAGEQDTLETDIDTGALGRGEYRILIAQSDGVTHEIPARILPPNPKLANLPLRVNFGESRQALRLEGSGLDRIESLASEAGVIQLGPASGGAARDATIELAGGAGKGRRFAARMKVEGVDEPVEVPGALEILGPRPRITSARTSIPAGLGVLLREGELPAGTGVSFALAVENVTAPPAVELSCANEAEVRQPLTIPAGGAMSGVRVEFAGENLVYVSLDPAVIGHAGCRLVARVRTADAGASDARPLGRVVRVPHIEQFTLTDEKLGEGVYAGILKGSDLDTIEKAAWDDRTGLPVPSIPAPVPGESGKQTLRIALPWPSPEPHAPLFVWLRGQGEGRATGVKY